jgi:tetratricopeptide (TPR) repeat protein
MLAAAIAFLVLRGAEVRALVDRNNGHLDLLRAQLSTNPEEQRQLFEQANARLGSGLQAGADSSGYLNAQLMLAPFKDCPAPADDAMGSIVFTLNERTAGELARWIEDKSVVPLCLAGGQLDSALAYYDWANAQYPNIGSQFERLPSQMAGALVERAFTRVEAGDLQGALSDWAAARSALPGASYDTFGDLVEKSAAGHRPAQQRLLALDVASSSGASSPRIYLAQAYNATGQGHEALDAISPLVDAESTDTRAWQQYGQALIALQRLPAAETALRHAVQLAPNDPAALNRMGVFYLATGRAEQAEPFFRQALARAGADSYWLWEHLGDALLAQQRPQEAAEAYRAAIKAVPGELSASAGEKLQKIDPQQTDK